MTVTWLYALETTNDRKGFGICIFTNKPASLKCCLYSRPCSAYPGHREDTASTSLLAKKHRKTKQLNKLRSESDLMIPQMTTILVFV